MGQPNSQNYNNIQDRIRKLQFKSAKPTTDEPFVLFDNNSFELMIRNNNSRFSLNIHLYLRNNFRFPKKDMEIGLTPPAMLETLGIKPKNCTVRPLDVSSTCSPDTVSKFLVATYDFFIEQEYLSKNYLNSQYLEKQKYLSKSGKELFRLVVEKYISNDDNIVWAAKALSWNYCLSFSRNNSVSKEFKYQIYGLIDLRVMPDFSRLRIISEYFRERFCRNPRLIRDPNLVCLKDALKIDSIGDGLDCDLVHASFFGYNKKTRMVIVTNDPPASAMWRVRGYKKFAPLIAAQFSTMDTFPEMINGTIVCCDAGGNVRQMINIEDEPILVFIPRNASSEQIAAATNPYLSHRDRS